MALIKDPRDTYDVETIQDTGYPDQPTLPAGDEYDWGRVPEGDIARYWNEYYWSDPKRVSRDRHRTRARSEDLDMPDWYRDTLDEAYTALDQQNLDRPWYMWEPLPYDHPVNERLFLLPPPPQDFLTFREQQKYEQYQPIAPDQLPSPAQAGMTDEEWGELPVWEKVTNWLMSSPLFGAGMMSIAGGAIGTAVAGPVGMVAGAAALGGYSYWAISETQKAMEEEREPAKLASALMLLDYPRLWIEQAFGLTYQVGGAITQPEEYGALDDLLANLPEAWRASGIFYEAGAPAWITVPAGAVAGWARTAGSPVGAAVGALIASGVSGDTLNAMAKAELNITEALQAIAEDVGSEELAQELEDHAKLILIAEPGEVFAPSERGRLVPTPIEGEAPGDVLAVMMEARNRLSNLRPGETPQDVLDEFTLRYGLTGQFRDLVSGFVLDPLDQADVITRAGGVQLAKAMGNVPLETAFRTTRGLAEGRQMYNKLIRLMPIEEASNVGRFSTWMAGLDIDEAGRVTALAKPKEGGLNYLRQLTRASRATEVTNNAGIMIPVVLERAVDDIGMQRMIHGLAETPDQLARELSIRTIQSADGAAIPLALKDGLDDFDNWFTVYREVEPQRNILANIARALEVPENEVLRRMGQVDDAEVLLRSYVDVARESGDEAAGWIVRAYDSGELTAPKVAELVKFFVDDKLPYNLDMLRAETYKMSLELMENWAAKWFGVKPEPTWVRLSQVVKSAQSLALLGLNPTYFGNNAINNIVTMVATGVFGARPMGKIYKFWDNFLGTGIEPPRLGSGMGPHAPGEVIEYPSIRAATQTPGMLNELQKFFGEKTRKVAIFSKLSQKAEQWSSNQAYTVGTEQMWGRFHRVGEGFDHMPEPLKRTLSDINPDLPRHVYSIIEGGMNQAEIEARLFDTTITRRNLAEAIPYLVEDARARGVDMTEVEVNELFRHAGIYDEIAEGVVKATDDLDVDNVLRKAQDTADERFDELTARELEFEAEKVATQVQFEGTQAVMELYDKVEIDYTERWLQGYQVWEETFHITEGMTDAQKNAIFTTVRNSETKAWDRFYARERAGYLGISKGLGLDSEPARAILTLIDERATNNKTFYDRKGELYTDFFKEKYPTPEERQIAWDTTQREIYELGAERSRQEVVLQQSLDEQFVGMVEAQLGAGAGVSAAKWRKGVLAIREEMLRDLQVLQDALLDATGEGRRDLWHDFLRKGDEPYLDRIIRLVQANTEGSRTFIEEVTGRRLPEVEGIPEVPPPAEVGRRIEEPAGQRLWQDLEHAKEEIRKTYEETLRPGENIEDIVDEELSRLGFQTEADLQKYNAGIIDKFVEEPAQALARELLEEGKIPYQSNAYGPGRKGVDWIDRSTGERGFTALEEVAPRVEPEIKPPQSARKLKNKMKKAEDTIQDFQREQGYSEGEVYQVGETLPRAEPQPVHEPLGSVDALHTSPPIGRMEEEGWYNQIRPLLSSLRKHLTGENAKIPEGIQNIDQAIDPVSMRELKKYLGQVYGQMADSKIVSMRWGENRRDASLLNYSRRYGYDNLLSAVFPYQFWYQKSAIQWALRAIDRPTWFSNYARIRDMQRNVLRIPGFPTRLQSKMKIPIPFMPEWMGGGIYVDPMRQVFPFEQFARPFEQVATQEHQAERRAEYVLAEMVDNGEITNLQAQQALATREGPHWIQAITTAKMETEAEITNPLDFANLMVGMSLPLNYAYQALRGTPENISQLPVTRLIQNLTGLIGMNDYRGVNIEAPIRKALGLPEMDKWQDFRVDRELSNMAAEGLISKDDATRAMVEKTGPAYLQAEQRAAQAGRARYLGAPLGADLFPEGEQKQRALKGEYDKARDAWLETDDYEGTLGKFFDTYPEYESRMLLFKSDPDERLRAFLRSEIWDMWINEVPDLHKRELEEEFGEVFRTAFLNKETRSYDSIDTATFTYWAQAMGAYVPEAEIVPELPQMGIELAPPAIAGAYQAYIDEKRERFPEIGKWLEYSFSLSPEEQKTFSDMVPEIDEYYTWRNRQFADHPEIIPYALGEQAKMAGASQEEQTMYYQFQATRDELFPGVYDLQDQYYDLPKSQRKKFRENNPSLPAYWEYRREFMAQYPNMIPFIMSEQSLAEKVLGKDYIPPADISQFSPALISRLMNYYLVGGELGAGTRRALYRHWESNDFPGGTFQKYVEEVVRAGFGQ